MKGDSTLSLEVIKNINMKSVCYMHQGGSNIEVHNKQNESSHFLLSPASQF